MASIHLFILLPYTNRFYIVLCGSSYLNLNLPFYPLLTKEGKEILFVAMGFRGSLKFLSFNYCCFMGVMASTHTKRY